MTTEQRRFVPGDLSPELVLTLRLTAQGMDRAAIAKHVGVTVDAIKSRFVKLKKVTGCKNQAHMVAWAYNQGVLLLDRDVPKVEKVYASLAGERAKGREVAQKLKRAEARIAELEAELRAAQAQLTSTPWLTTNRSRV